MTIKLSVYLDVEEFLPRVRTGTLIERGGDLR